MSSQESFFWNPIVSALELGRFSIERRKIDVISTLANHKAHGQSSEPIKTQRKYMKPTQSAGKRIRMRYDPLLIGLTVARDFKANSVAYSKLRFDIQVKPLYKRYVLGLKTQLDGLMVSAFVSGLSCPGSSPVQEYRVVFLSKTLNSHRPANSTLRWTSIPSRWE